MKFVTLQATTIHLYPTRSTSTSLIRLHLLYLLNSLPTLPTHSTLPPLHLHPTPIEPSYYALLTFHPLPFPPTLTFYSSMPSPPTPNTPDMCPLCVLHLSCFKLVRRESEDHSVGTREGVRLVLGGCPRGMKKNGACKGEEMNMCTRKRNGKIIRL